MRLSPLALALLVAAWAPRASASPTLGVMMDAGVPDGANASLVYRTTRWLRLHAGAGHNAISPGVRAGLSILPIDFSVSPSVVLEAGRYFRGDANPLMQRLTGDPEYDNPMLREVGYDYGNAHLGLEFGQRRFTFYIHGGMSYIDSDVRNADAALGEDSDIRFGDDPRVRGFVPSGRVGLVLYLF